LFEFDAKQICLFRLFRYRFETPKQTEMFCFWFHETNRNKRETNLVSVCFGSNRNLFLFVSRTPYIEVIEAKRVTCVIKWVGRPVSYSPQYRPTVYYPNYKNERGGGGEGNSVT
jgi:hypothetical protein